MKESEFNSVSVAHRNKVAIYFIVFFMFSSVSFFIKEWVGKQRGWEAEVVYTIFYVAMSATGLLALMFGYLVFAWYKYFKYAKRDSSIYDAEQLKNHWPQVVGPIRWR